MRTALILLLLALALATIPACTNVVPRTRVASPPAPESVQELFLESFEQLKQSDDSSALETLRRKHPESVWTRQANTLADLYRAKRDQVKAQRDLRACRAAEKRCEAQIARLKNDLQKMKNLVIEMELRSK